MKILRLKERLEDGEDGMVSVCINRDSQLTSIWAYEHDEGHYTSDDYKICLVLDLALEKVV
jgi:hypothetical protein